MHRKTSRSHRARRALGCVVVPFLVAGLPMDLAHAAPGQVKAAAVSQAAPVSVGPMTVLLSGSQITSSFTLTTSSPTTFAQVQTAVRLSSDPSSDDGRLDLPGARDVTVDGTHHITGSANLAPGTYMAHAAYLLDGTWVNSPERVSFTIAGDTPDSAPTSYDLPVTAETAPPPSPTTSPVTAPSPVPTPSAPARTGTVGSASGFSPGGAFPYLSDGELAEHLDAMQASGAGWVRVDFSWSSVERDRGTFDWRHLDRVTGAAAARGIKVLAMPAYSPSWARPAGCDSNKCAPTDPADFARFVVEAATRYGPDRVQAWELWNEPNIPAFWAPKPDADAYAALLTRSASALRAVSPDAYIVSAGLSPAYTDGTRVAPVDFVKRLYALGALRDVDAVGMHPYSADRLPLSPGTESWNTFLQMKTAYDVMTAHGDGHKQIWATEFGVATGTSEKSTTESQQAAMITEGFQRLGDGTWPWLGTLFAYSLRDSADDLGDWQSNFGLTRHDGTPKPAYTRFSEAMKLPLVR